MSKVTLWNACSLTQKIARWKHVDMRLAKLTEHERLKHFDMGNWGSKTDCGTVACAGGHAGFDPWFRARGFRASFRRYHVERLIQFSVDPEDFFGDVGTQWIFCGPAQTVEQVRAQIGWYIGELKARRTTGDTDRDGDLNLKLDYDEIEKLGRRA